MAAAGRLANTLQLISFEKTKKIDARQGADGSASLIGRA
jgi:hypothetical protein